MREIVILVLIILAVIALFFGLSYLFSRILFPQPSELSATPTPTINLPPIVIQDEPDITIIPPTSPPTLTPTLPPPQGGAPSIIIIPSQKTFTGLGFTLSYPTEWGLLTCANSLNFEFDPLNNTDQIGVICSFATKPITVLVDNNLTGCTGETIRLGTIPVTRSVTTTEEIVVYNWCTITQPVLKISHRVSNVPLDATSPVDFSTEIENMIATAKFTSVSTPSVD